MQSVRLVVAAVFSVAALWFATPQPALAALPPDDACSLIIGGDLNLLLPVGGAGNNSLSGHPFVVGDVITFNWTGLASVGQISALTIYVNNVVTFTSNLPSGTTSITITQVNTDLFEAALAFGMPGPSSVTVGCDAASPPPPPPPPPPPSGLAADFLDQNAGSGVAALTGDAMAVGTFAVADTPVPACDEKALRAKVAELRSRYNKFVAMLDRLRVVAALIRTYESDIAREKDGDKRAELKKQLEKFQREQTTLYDGLGVPDGNGFLELNRDYLAELEVDIAGVDLADAEAELKKCLEGPPTADIFYTDPSPAADPLGAFAAFFGDSGMPRESFSFATPLGYAGTGVVTQQGVTIDDWTFWVAGRVSGLNSLGTNSFGALNGRIDLGASRALGSSILVGGFLGWDGGRSTNTTTGGTTASNAVHAGAYGTYRLPNDMVLALSGGGALGALTSTIAGDSGTTATQRAFLNASVTGTAWSDGPWRVTPSGTLFIGAEHQDAFTTDGGVAVPEQTITLGRAKVDALIGYALPTELPTELFVSIGGGYDFGNTAPFAPGQLSGQVGTGLNVSQGTMRGSLSATYGLIGSTGSSWGINASIGASY